MKFAINVGLNVKGIENHAIDQEARAEVAHLAIGAFIRHRGSWSSQIRIVGSFTEPTLVIEGFLHDDFLVELNGFLFKLAIALSQDCIALARIETGEDTGGAPHEFAASGWLVGPNAHEWGDFDPKFFVL